MQVYNFETVQSLEKFLTVIWNLVLKICIKFVTFLLLFKMLKKMLKNFKNNHMELKKSTNSFETKTNRLPNHLFHNK